MPDSERTHLAIEDIELEVNELEKTDYFALISLSSSYKKLHDEAAVVIEQIQSLLQRGVSQEFLAARLLPLIQTAILQTSRYGGSFDLQRVITIAKMLNIGNELFQVSPELDLQKMHLVKEGVTPEELIKSQAHQNIYDFFYIRTKSNAPNISLSDHGKVIISDQTPLAQELVDEITSLRSMGILAGEASLDLNASEWLRSEVIKLFIRPRLQIGNVGVGASEYVRAVVLPRLLLCKSLDLTVTLHALDERVNGYYNSHDHRTWQFFAERNNSGYTAISLASLIDFAALLESYAIETASLASVVRFANLVGHQERDTTAVRIDQHFSLPDFLKFILIQSGSKSQKWAELVSHMLEVVEFWGLEKEPFAAIAREEIQKIILTVGKSDKPAEVTSLDPSQHSSGTVGILHFDTIWKGLDDNARKAIFSDEFFNNEALKAKAMAAFLEAVELNVKTLSNATNVLSALQNIFDFKPEELQEIAYKLVSLLFAQRKWKQAKAVIDTFANILPQYDQDLQSAHSELLVFEAQTAVIHILSSEDFDFRFFERFISIAASDNQAIEKQLKACQILIEPKIFEMLFSGDTIAYAKLHNLLRPETAQWLIKLDQHLKEVLDDPFDYFKAKITPAVTDQRMMSLIPHLATESLWVLFPITMEKILSELWFRVDNLDIADYFVENLDKYYQTEWVVEVLKKALGHYSVSKKFVSSVEGQAVWSHEPWVAECIAVAQATIKAHELPDHDDDFDDEDFDDDYDGYGGETQGLSEVDPNESHEWKRDTYNVLITSVYACMRSLSDGSRLAETQIDSEVVDILSEINEKVEIAYRNFLDQVTTSNIPETDKQYLLHPEAGSVKMNSLLDKVRFFVAIYITLMAKGDLNNVEVIESIRDNIDQVLKNGFDKFIMIYKVDIPLYDILYKEFDSYRDGDRSPLEVYLGRDGIYAWIGRRAQDVARRRSMGWERRLQLRSEGKVLEIHPKYLVYPRFFRDNILQTIKSDYLQQEGISPDADPIFFDTGFTGSIPEQIMEIMGFEREEIEARIRLLSAKEDHRRVKGISENARSEIVELIEHNAKTEETATGLLREQVTQKLRHIATPTTPEEQLHFMLIEQAITRHYYLKEFLS